MTLRKAMAVRSELKKASMILGKLMVSASYVLVFTGEAPDEETLAAEREKKSSKLDGLTYEEAVKKQFAITDAILNLNVAIDKANGRGHELLFKESSLKARLSIVDALVSFQRGIEEVSVAYETDYENSDNRGNYRKVKVNQFNYPVLKENALGMPLMELKKSIERELEEVRDELSVFNATTKIDYEVPDGLI